MGECAFSVDVLKPDSIQFNAHWVPSVDAPLDKTCICLDNLSESECDGLFRYMYVYY